MTSEEFRRLALAFPGAVESAHMGHPDFRRDGKIFATLHYPNDQWAMVKLSPEHQNTFVHLRPEIFKPAKGAWGPQGSTSICLKAADGSTLEDALRLGWENAAAPAKKSPRPRKRTA